MKGGSELIWHCNTIASQTIVWVWNNVASYCVITSRLDFFITPIMLMTSLHRTG